MWGAGEHSIFKLKFAVRNHSIHTTNGNIDKRKKKKKNKIEMEKWEIKHNIYCVNIGIAIWQNCHLIVTRYSSAVP